MDDHSRRVIENHNRVKLEKEHLKRTTRNAKRRLRYQENKLQDHKKYPSGYKPKSVVDVIGV